MSAKREENYETWCIRLWVGNDEGSYDICRSTALEAAEAEREEGSSREKCVSAASDALKREVEDWMPELGGMFSDLLTNAMSRVDWNEVAEAVLPEEWGEHGFAEH